MIFPLLSVVLMFDPCISIMQKMQASGHFKEAAFHLEYHAGELDQAEIDYLAAYQKTQTNGSRKAQLLRALGENKEMMLKPRCEVGTVVQLSPTETKNKMFSACLMVVTEVKDWGVQGYVQSLGANGEAGGQAYYRAEWGTFERILPNGTAPWIRE